MPNNRIQSLTVDGVTYDIVDNTSGYATLEQLQKKANLVTAYVLPSITDGSTVTLYRDVWCSEPYDYLDLCMASNEGNDYYHLIRIGFTDGDGDADYYLYEVSLKYFYLTLTQLNGLSNFDAYFYNSGWTANATFTYNEVSNDNVFKQYADGLVSGLISTETDPVFTASAAHGISSSDITNWNGKTTVQIVRW